MYTTIDWGPEGSQIWMGSNIGLSMLSVMRPAGVANPLMVCRFVIKIFPCNFEDF